MTTDDTRDQLIRKAHDAIIDVVFTPAAEDRPLRLLAQQLAAAAVDAVLSSDLIPEGVTTEQWGVRFAMEDPNYVPGVVWTRDQLIADDLVRLAPRTRRLIHRVTTIYPPRHHTTEVQP